MIVNLVKPLTILLPVLISVAYVTLAERKIMGAVQRRKGPTKVGYLGLLQPIADGVKLVIKETIIPQQTQYKQVFILAPVATLAIHFITWSLMPLNKGVNVVDLDVGLLFLLALSGISIYGIILGGYASQSRYGILGAIRSTAQIISYEIAISIIVLNVVLLTNSFNITTIILAQQDMWNIVPLLPLFIMFMVSILAETNRPPFDLPESEGELVAGFNVEYSAIGFASYYIAEYGAVVLMSTLTSILFLGGFTCSTYHSSLILGIKTSLIIFYFVLVRSTYPRYRYDQLMNIGWKNLIPLSFAILVLNLSLL